MPNFVIWVQSSALFDEICIFAESAKKYSYKKTTTYKSANLKKLNSNYSGIVSGTRASVINNAEHYLGTPYKYAGNTKAGFDCSGLVCKVFDENNILIYLLL